MLDNMYVHWTDKAVDNVTCYSHMDILTAILKHRLDQKRSFSNGEITLFLFYTTQKWMKLIFMYIIFKCSGKILIVF